MASEPDSTPIVLQPPPGQPAPDPDRAPTPSHAEAPATGGQRLTTPEGPFAAAFPPTALPGAGRYQFLAELAQGRVGVVSMVRDSVLGRLVALRASPDAGEMR